LQVSTKTSEDPLCDAFNEESGSRVFLSCNMASTIKTTVANMEAGISKESDLSAHLSKSSLHQ
jgi:hypothetical protein